MDVKKVKKCKYNPRSMSRSARLALKASIEEFDDIAGITINESDGSLICGNHRFDELCKKYGRDTLEFRQVVGEFHAIYSNDKFINYIVRIVNWPDYKAKSANITANNTLVQGEFTSELQLQLDDIALNTPESLFDGLRLSELRLDLSSESDLSFDLEEDSEYAKKANDMLEDALGEEPEPVKEVISVIKVSVPEGIRDRVKGDLMEYLSKRPYYNDVVIV